MVRAPRGLEPPGVIPSPHRPFVAEVMAARTHVVQSREEIRQAIGKGMQNHIFVGVLECLADGRARGTSTGRQFVGRQPRVGRHGRRLRTTGYQALAAAG